MADDWVCVHCGYTNSERGDFERRVEGLAGGGPWLGNPRIVRSRPSTLTGRTALKKPKPLSPPESKPPTTRQLSALLGGSYGAFKALTQRGAGVTQEWRRYSTTSPWVLKVILGARTLFYVTPKVDALEVTVLLGKRATEAALAGRVSKAPTDPSEKPGRMRRAGPSA